MSDLKNNPILSFMETDLMISLEEDCKILEMAESHGLRGNGAQFLIDKHRIMANILNEYRDRRMTAQGLLVEWRNKILEHRRARND